jgi:signal transduction histidine kinase
VSVAGQAQLLHVTASRFTAEAALLLIPGLLTWLYSQQGPQVSALRLLPWVLGMAVLAAWLLWRRYLYRRDRAQGVSDAQLLARWAPESERVALVYGMAWAAPVLFTLGHAPLEFALALYMVLAGITAAATNYLASIFGFFLRFFLGIWVVALGAVVWMFPQHWYFMLPLTILYCVISYRHAQATHRFMVRQIQLEERSTYLAEQYKTAKEEAEQALTAKGLFLTTASHDLRQPVHALGMLLETTRRQNQDPALNPLLRDMGSCVRSLNLMFNSLLDLSKIESGTARPRAAWCDLHELLNEIVAVFREDATSRGLVLRLRLPPTRAWVQADPGLLRQALFNLTHNALRYTVQGGVLLALRKRQGGWQIDVCDTGMGVAEGEQQQIFSPFYRNTIAWDVDSAGHGLGLAVVARCAKLMQAQYGLRSRLGRGSRFWLRFEHRATARWEGKAMHGLAGAAAYTDALPPIADYQPEATLTGRCLVVEDDPQVSKAWALLMASWGLDTRFACDSKEALALLDAGFEPQAIFCDQRLRSGESGFELLRALLERCPHAHGAMVSGEFNAPELAQAENDGYLVLRKPLNTAEMHAVLERWLQPVGA